LHVVRAELERVRSKEFKGRRVRFVGDCVHGLICEGTAHTTDEKETISAATLLAGAFRSSFDLALERLEDEGYETGNLGLAIGFDYGPMTITRLGLKSDRVRCSVSRGVLESESQQKRCTGVETAIGAEALKVASDAVKTLFGTQQKVKDLDFNEATEALSDAGDKSASIIRKETYAKTPAVLAATQREIRPYCEK
ncbi:MAG: transcriptional regulator, partial [Burkholderiaceae bacterium]|nr:transcriptional regulator [Burkholderiaceae bacterium]